MSDYEFLVDYLSKNMDGISLSSGVGLVFDFPNFDLMPCDYLEFAEQDLSKDSVSARIGCVSNLKRATQCELDTLLHVLGLTSNVTFQKKLDFVSKVGLASPRALEKLSHITEKMDRYSVPERGELEAYFDLTSGFVHAIEGYIYMLVSQAEQQWRVEENVAFDVKLMRTPAQIEFSIRLPEQTKKLLFGANNLDRYLDALKVFFLLCRSTLLLSNDYVVAKLTGNPLTIRAARG